LTRASSGGPGRRLGKEKIHPSEARSPTFKVGSLSNRAKGGGRIGREPKDQIACMRWRMRRGGNCRPFVPRKEEEIKGGEAPNTIKKSTTHHTPRVRMELCCSPC